MEGKKVSTTVYITQEQNSLLKQLNQKTKVPIAEYIREGIDLVLERYRHNLPGQMMLLQEEPSNGNRRGPTTTQKQS
jgi:hypothetical protein